MSICKQHTAPESSQRGRLGVRRKEKSVWNKGLLRFVDKGGEVGTDWCYSDLS